MVTFTDQIRAQSRDLLTGLADIEHARRTIRRWLDEWPQGDAACPLNAMLISLGRIDTVNVAFGESAGDDALVEISRRIRHFATDELESGEWLASRVSGGTFLLAAQGACSRERWQWLAEALADAIVMPISNASGGANLRIWPRIGLMRATREDTPDSILDRLAETSARMRETTGRRICWASSEFSPQGRSTQQLEADLLAAIDRNEIEILFQPQYSLQEDTLVGAEALARWQHPKLGQIGADTLFAMAERADHTAQLSRHIAERALTHAIDWPDHMRLSINITPADLAADSFAPEFARMAERVGFPLERITLEITEQVLLEDLDRVVLVLDQLKIFGVRLALDDFGAGFCNFKYLKSLPIDNIKLDRSMIDGLLEGDKDLAVFRAITAMAAALGLRVVVEGVEREDQRAMIAAEGCEYYQGFLRAEPLSASEFSTLVAS